MRFARGLLALTLFSPPALAESLVGAPADPTEPPGGTRPAGRLVPAPDVPAGRDVEPGPDLRDRNDDGVADGLAARLARAAANERFDVIAAFATPGHAAAARRALGPVDLRHEYDLIPGFAAGLTAGQVRALTRMPGVLRVEEVAPVHAFMEAERRDFGVDRAQAPSSAGGLVLDGLDGSGIGICVVDTGVFADQEQLDGKAIAFIDLVNGRASPYDDQGHGTHVASIASGDGTAPDGGDQAGAALYRGVAPGASLYAAKVLDASGNGTSADVIAGVEWCADQPGVDVMNLSLGETGSSDGADLLSQAINAAVNEGTVVVVAAGNSGAAPYTIGSPAAASLAITVGAAAEWSASSIVQGESDGLYLAPFSSRGPTADGRVKPDIVAPGVSVIAGYIDPWNGLPGFSTCTTECYASLSGTSMAAPFTTGTVALMLQADPTLTPAEVKGLLSGTAQDRGPGAGEGAPAVKDNDWGWGLLDAYAAVAAAAGDTGATPTAFPAYGLGTGDVSGGGTTVVPIAVTDNTAPLAVAVTVLDGGQQLFCDIFLGCFYEWRPDFDIRLRDPNGTIVAEGFCMLGSQQGGECDNVGRQETVHVPTPLVGTYTLEVYKGTSDSANGPFRYEVSQGPVGSPSPPAPNQEPVAAAAADPSEVTDGDGDGFGTVTLDGSGSYDPDGSIVAHDWSWSTWSNSGEIIEVSLPVGSHTITLTVTDDRGASASDDVAVTVNEAPANNPPVADAGADQEVTLSKGKTVPVALDGTGSSDADGSVVSWQWSEGGAVIATGATPDVKLAEGAHDVSLVVTDDDGAPSAPDTVTITVTKGGDGGGGGGGSCHPRKGCS